MAAYTAACPIGTCEFKTTVRRDVNLGEPEPPGTYEDCVLLAYERMTDHLRTGHPHDLRMP
jgi:hypothetical protein